mgnify:CR=1 FL=1|tara:strand:+ start:1972 stop:2832 length:861 start_codon:yes stop_codon:yes gene_type:complete
MKILLIGAHGILGTKLFEFLKIKGHDVLKTNRTRFSLKENEYSEYINEFKRIIAIKRPEIVINLLALTNVDYCEMNMEEAFISNVLSLESIIEFLNDSGVFLIHISTDQVYSSGIKHKEDLVSPCNIYGLTKYTSELVANKANSTILRTNYVGKSLLKTKQSLTDWFVNSCKSKEKIILFKDIFFNPLHSKKLCEIIELVSYKKKKGTYNLGTVDFISKAEFLIQIHNKLKLNNPNMQISSSVNIKTKAKRPLYMVTEVSKFEKIFDIKLPNIKDTICSVANDYLT